MTNSPEIFTLPVVNAKVLPGSQKGSELLAQIQNALGYVENRGGANIPSLPVKLQFGEDTSSLTNGRLSLATAGLLPSTLLTSQPTTIVLEGPTLDQGVHARIGIEPTLQGWAKRIIHFTNNEPQQGIAENGFKPELRILADRTFLVRKVDAQVTEVDNLQGPKEKHSRGIFLLTDFGEDRYAGVLKAVIEGFGPFPFLHDITHNVPDYSIRKAANILAETAKYAPRGTVFGVVVDPGVGTERRSIAVETQTGQIFVGPDNGLFPATGLAIKTAHEIKNPRFFRNPEDVSNTFHGRDVFASTAALLARGEPIESVGPRVRIDDLTYLPPFPSANAERGGILSGSIVDYDHYGVIFTNIPEGLFTTHALAPRKERGTLLQVEVGSRKVHLPFVLTYGNVQPGEWYGAINSGRHFEFGKNQASGYAELKPELGTPVIVQKIAE